MKIAFVLTTLEYLGPFIVAKDIVDGLIDKVDKIDIYYLKDTPDKANFAAPTIKIDFLKSIDFSSYDVIHSHGFLADMYVSVHLKKRARWINTLHQKIYPNYKLSHNPAIAFFLERIWLAGLRKTNCVATLTKEMKQYYAPKLPKNLIQHCYNGIPPNQNPKTLPDAEKAKIEELKAHTRLLGISARLVYLKGIDQVIKALALNNQYSLLLIGDGPERTNLEEAAKTLNVLDRCYFLGYKENPTDYLRHCDLYVMSSRTEGFGLCVIEAASEKVPVVCSDLPVYKELLAMRLLGLS